MPPQLDLPPADDAAALLKRVSEELNIPEGEDWYCTPEQAIAFLRRSFYPEGGNWAGLPWPVPNYTMTIHPKYPFAELYSKPIATEQVPEVGTYENAPRQVEDDKLIGALLAVARTINTIGVSNSWSLQAEFRAIKKLRRHISVDQWAQYVLTGTFGHVSPQSRVAYIFRRLRPTLAMNQDSRFLAALCLHPIGYYDCTWAGAMVPTDDILAHYLLMRADEPYFWRKSNQHPLREHDLWR